jgi:hypothetical protein
MKYWLEDNQGKHHIFEAKDDKDAADYFWNSGDRVYDYGRADKEYFKNRLKYGNDGTNTDGHSPTSINGMAQRKR